MSGENELPLYILDLKLDSDDADVDHALGLVLDCTKREVHTSLLVQIAQRTGRPIDEVQHRYRAVASKLEEERGRARNQKFQAAVPLSSRLRLKSLLTSRGIIGQEVFGERDAMCVADPLSPENTVIVRDARLFGFKPIVDGSGALDEYVSAFTKNVPEIEILAHCLSYREALQASEVVMKADEGALRKIPPREYQLPNLDALKAAEAGDIDMILLELNRRYAIVDLDGQIKVSNAETKTMYDETNFYRSLKRKIFIGGDKDAKPIELAKLWFDWPARAAYAGRRLFPDGKTGEGRSYLDDPTLCRYLNSWQGYAVTPREGDWSLMGAHILNVVCRGNKVAYEYLLNWMAHRLQKPWQKPRVAIVTWGEKQIGKSLVADELRKIIGAAHTAILNKKGEVVGQFVDLSQVIFCQSEEALYAGDPSTVSIVKHNVTSDTVRVEPKWMMAEDRPSYTGYWFTGNATNPVHVSHDEERFLVLHASSEKKGNKAYFHAILDQMRNGGREAMLYDLQRRDLSNFDILAVPPTEAFGKMVLDQLPKKERPIAEMLCEGAIVIRDRDGKVEKRISLRHDKHVTVDADDMYRYLTKAFAEYGEQHGRASMIGSFLKTELRIVVRHIETDSRREQKAAYVLHSLDDMRETMAARWKVKREELGHRDDPERESTPREILIAALEDLRQAQAGLAAVAGEEGNARALAELIATLEADLCRSKFANDNAQAA
jgi:hypothetical protein